MTSDYQKRWAKANPGKIKAAQEKYRAANKDKCTARTVKSNRTSRSKYREVAILHYGGTPPKCNCCGEKERKFLTIDHINGGGRKHRKELKNTLGGVHGWLVRNNFPEGFQVLCMNCNWGKYINNGTCPHKK